MSRIYRELSKHGAREYRKEDLDLRAKLGVAIDVLHDYTYDVNKQGEVTKLKNAFEMVEARKAKGAAIKS